MVVVPVGHHGDVNVGRIYSERVERLVKKGPGSNTDPPPKVISSRANEHGSTTQIRPEVSITSGLMLSRRMPCS
jgi:hypothetical protein